MLEIAKLELFCTSISAADKNANVYHNLIISLNKASTEKKKKNVWPLWFKESMKSTQPQKQSQELRNPSPPQSAGPLPSADQQRQRRQILSGHQANHRSLDGVLSLHGWRSNNPCGFCPRNTYHSSAQSTGSSICGRGTADTEDLLTAWRVSTPNFWAVPRVRCSCK